MAGPPDARADELSAPARVSRLLLPALVFVIALVTFLPGLDGQFLNWDDDLNFLTNPNFRGLGWSNLRWMFSTTLTGHWIPLSWLTLGVNYALGGMSPWGYHLDIKREASVLCPCGR